MYTRVYTNVCTYIYIYTYMYVSAARCKDLAQGQKHKVKYADQ